MEEIIIFEQDGNIVGITKEGKYFESYKTTENVAILRGAGLYIKRLEQENEKLKKELEPYKHPDVVTLLNLRRTGKLDEIYNKIANERDKYKRVLEEIREIAKYDCEYECSNNNENCTIESCLEKRIQRKINEVLK